MTITGADSNALEALGATMRGAAEQLEVIRAQLRSAILVDVWRGGDAAEYRSRWTSTYDGTMTRAARGLRDTAEILNRNAREQRAASAADSSGNSAGINPGTPRRNSLALPGPLAGVVVTGGQLAWFFRHLGAYERGEIAVPPYLVNQLPGLPWAISEGKNELERMLTADPAGQAAWWAGLSEAQRAALLFAYPGALLALRGLPAGISTAAAKQFALSKRGTLELSSSQETMSGEFKLGVVNISGEAKAEVRLYADKSAEVTLTLTGDLGREFGAGGTSAGVGVQGGVEVTYRFVSAEMAQQFVDELKDRLAPDVLRSIARDGAIDYLRLNDWAKQSTEASLALTGSAEVKIGGMSAHVSGSAGGTYNFDTHERTLFVQLGGGASAGALGGDLSGTVSLQVDAQGTVTGATLSGTLSANGSMSSGDLVKSLSGAELQGDVSASAVQSVSFSAAVNPNDPAVQADLLRLAQNPGDAAAVQSLLGHSDAQITVSGSTSTSATIGGGLASATHSVTSTTMQSSYAKPAGGPWVSLTN